MLSVSILCVQYYGVKLWSNSGDPIGWVCAYRRFKDSSRQVRIKHDFTIGTLALGVCNLACYLAI